jgi:hypothetical protein
MEESPDDPPMIAATIRCGRRIRLVPTDRGTLGNRGDRPTRRSLGRQRRP